MPKSGVVSRIFRTFSHATAAPLCCSFISRSELHVHIHSRAPLRAGDIFQLVISSAFAWSVPSAPAWVDTLMWILGSFGSAGTTKHMSIQRFNPKSRLFGLHHFNFRIHNQSVAVVRFAAVL